MLNIHWYHLSQKLLKLLIYTLFYFYVCILAVGYVHKSYLSLIYTRVLIRALMLILKTYLRSIYFFCRGSFGVWHVQILKKK